MSETAFKASSLRTRAAPLWLMLSLSFLWSKGSTAGTEMIDFTQANEHKNWTATNDNVMGGISTGGLIYAGGMSQFKGELTIRLRALLATSLF